MKRETLREEVERLRKAVLNQSGDNLGRLTPDDLRKIPPKAEFLQSCDHFHTQIASGAGELVGCQTIAQLERDNLALRLALDAYRAKLKKARAELRGLRK